MKKALKFLILMSSAYIQGMGNISAYYGSWMILANHTQFAIKCDFEISSTNYLSLSKMVNTTLPSPISLDILGRTVTIAPKSVAIFKITRYMRNMHLPVVATVSLNNGTSTVSKNLKILIEPRNPQRTSVVSIAFDPSEHNSFAINILTVPDTITLVKKTLYSPLPSDYELTFANKEMKYLGT